MDAMTQNTTQPTDFDQAIGAVEAGIRNKGWFDDDDLASLRNEPRFKALVASLQ